MRRQQIKKYWSSKKTRPKPWTETQTDEAERAAQQVKRARTILRQVPKQWEESWWTNFAEEAEEAGNKGDSTRMFSACKELRDRRERARDGGTQKGVENPEEEREAWKQHFETIQAGSGEVSESVWEHLGEPCEIEEWLGEEPDGDEIWKSAEKMKCGKAAGEDDVAVEMIRFAGNALKKTVCKIVRKHWREAGEAEAGNEAEKLPDEWKIALQVPLWKKKGERSDKNTWRGITLLSVGTK